MGATHSGVGEEKDGFWWVGLSLISRKQQHNFLGNILKNQLSTRGAETRSWLRPPETDVSSKREYVWHENSEDTGEFKEKLASVLSLKKSLERRKI